MFTVLLVRADVLCKKGGEINIYIPTSGSDKMSQNIGLSDTCRNPISYISCYECRIGRFGSLKPDVLERRTAIK